MIKSILFNTEEVRRVLDGRKTVKRMVCKDANDFTVPDISYFDADKRTYAVHNYANKDHTDQLSIAERVCPICPGDILYVREAWKKYEKTVGKGESWHLEKRLRYKADDNKNEPCEFYDKNWHSPVNMPKEAARIWLKVMDVWVERMQDITWQQAAKEGCSGFTSNIIDDSFHSLRKDFKILWDSTCKKSLQAYGWDANPWVWVIEFERCKKPAPCAIRNIEAAQKGDYCIGYAKSDIDDEPCEMCKECRKCIGNDLEDFENIQKGASEESCAKYMLSYRGNTGQGRTGDLVKKSLEQKPDRQ